MDVDNSVLLPSLPLVLMSGDVPGFSEPKVRRPNDDSSSRMNDDGSPNENPSVEDATGFSNEEEEA